MSQKISIARKDGTKINLNGDGNIWHVQDKTGGPLLGQIFHRVCNVVHVHGFDEKRLQDRKLEPINYLLLKYANRLGISKIRIQQTRFEDTRIGPILKVRYGYLPDRKFKYLLDHRRIKEVPRTKNTRAVMIKKSDFHFESI
jgi:hypothetical protein